jgi:hypothetical protein
MISLQNVRGIAGIILIAVFSVTANVQLFRAAYTTPHPPSGQDAVSLYDKRFDELRKDLPKDARIGYITDLPPQNILTLANPSAIQALYMAQYSLAPVIVDIGAARTLVVGNFFIPRDLTYEISDHKLSLIKDYGNGVFLFRKAGR